MLPISKELADITSLQKQSYNETHYRRRYIRAVENTIGYLSETALQQDEYFCYKNAKPNYPLKTMSLQFANETVRYFTKEGLEKIQIFIINGIFYNGNLTRYSSRTPLVAETGDGEMITMDRIGNTFISLKVRKVIQHSSFFSSKPLAFAGLCYIQDGYLQHLVAYSGHYNTTPNELAYFHNHLSNCELEKKPAIREISIIKGYITQTIQLDPNQTIHKLYKTIAKLSTFSRLSLFFNNTLIQNNLDPVKRTILENNCVVCAVQRTFAPTQTIFPRQFFKLTWE